MQLISILSAKNFQPKLIQIYDYWACDRDSEINERTLSVSEQRRFIVIGRNCIAHIEAAQIDMFICDVKPAKKFQSTT